MIYYRGSIFSINQNADFWVNT